MTTPVNKQMPGDLLYVAGLNGQEINLYAGSLYDAKQKAEKYFKPSKKNQGLLWVELATEKSPASL